MPNAKQRSAGKVEIDWVCEGRDTQQVSHIVLDPSSSLSTPHISEGAAFDVDGRREQLCETQPEINLSSLSWSLSEAYSLTLEERKANRKTRKKPSEPRATTSFHQNSLNGEESAYSENFQGKGQQSKDGMIEANVENSVEGVSLADNYDRTTEATEASENLVSASGFQERGVDQTAMKELMKPELVANACNISEREQEMNRQEQSDEVVALQAIFEEDFVSLEANEGASQTYMISIHVDITNALNVMVKLSNDSSVSQKDCLGSHNSLKAISSSSSGLISETSVGKIHACTLEFLPPVQLIYRLPMSYPSHSPPIFILSAPWLTKGMLSNLCQGLDSLWEVQVGEVVIYSWAEWLRINCFSHLRIIDELELDMCEKGSQDTRALTGFSALEIDVPWLIRYNEEQKNNEFMKAIHTCFICFTEQLGKHFVKLPCKHIFCHDCMKSYATINVKEGSVLKLYCPDVSCKGSIPPSILKQLLGLDEFIRWESLLLQKTLDSMRDVVYCPRCETVCIEDKDHHAQCTGCFFSFCSLCRGPRHVGQECMPAEMRLQILQERLKGSNSGEERRRKEQELFNELLNMKYVQQETKQCPACKMAISKIEGCNKVTCGNCGQYFCYQCNKAIDGYDHFREGCNLFEDVEIEHWERVINAHNFAQAHPEVLRPCPNCRQPNVKVCSCTWNPIFNNLIF